MPQQTKKKNKNKHRPKQPGHAKASKTRPAASKAREVEVSSGVFASGIVLLVIAAGASLMLVLQSLGSLSLPGCGIESACGRATSSVWGTIPGLGWPTAHVGFATFLALLVAWVATRGYLPDAIRWLVRLGGVVSIVLIGAMIAGGYLCMYCLSVHLANLLFIAMLEVTGRTERLEAAPVGRTVGWLLGSFVIATGGLAVAQQVTQSNVEKQDEQAREQSEQNIIAAQPEIVPFTGRYVTGPNPAPIRVVIISDYQCPDCQNIDGQMREILAERDDVAFSAMHFPFCTDCNWKARQYNMNRHQNACWAARAAETAGILQGNEGFWKMHHWLFDNKGAFTDAELAAGLRELGFDPVEFTRLMTSDQPLALVEADIDKAVERGLRQTPMIFINGEELTGWRANNALKRTIERVAATNPEPREMGADQPPNALEKYVGEWRTQRVRPLPPDSHDWTDGPPDAPARIVVWGDYTEPFTAELDARLRAAARANSDTSYAFRHYPFNTDCNSAMSGERRHPMACRAARVAEAAGIVGDLDGYWAMHDWLMENQDAIKDDFSQAEILQAAAAAGIDGAALLAAMDTQRVDDAIDEDCQAGRSMGLRGIPYLFINEHNVPFWRLEGELVPETILDEVRGR